MPADCEQGDEENREINNFNRFVSRIIETITDAVHEEKGAKTDMEGVPEARSRDVREEPFVETMADGASVTVIVDVRGMNREDIKVMARQTSVEVSFSGCNGGRTRQIMVPCVVDADRSYATLKNGVLEIRLAKADEGEAKAVQMLE